MCMICSDIKHFHSKVYDTEKILSFLSHYTSEQTVHITDHNLWMKLSMDRQHPHFMCGHCYKANTEELRRKEEQLAITVYDICMQLQSGTTLPTYEILHSLQGYYPLMWKCVHDTIRKSNN